MPFGHLALKCDKPFLANHLWDASKFPKNPEHIGEKIKKRRYELKMKAVDCQRILGVDKGTLADWESGKHEPVPKMHGRIAKFLADQPR